MTDPSRAGVPDRTPTFAFLVHPRADVRADLARIWRPLGLVPNRIWDRALRRLPTRPVTLADVHRTDRPTEGPAGWIVVVPVGARQMLTEDRRWVLGKVEQAVDRAQALGAGVVGLGALTAPVTGGGRLLRERPGLTVTTGNAFTAHLTLQAVRRVLPAATGRTVAVLGATGSVGSCLVRLLAGERVTQELILVARQPRRLAALAQEVTGAGVAARVATDVDAVRDADVVVVLTSSAEALLRSEHLRPGAIVIDDTQPRNTDPALARQRPDVLVLDGGVAAVPGLRVRGDIGLPPGLAYACLSETALMAMSGHGESSVGAADVRHATRMREAAERLGHLGFGLADPPLSFGRPSRWPEPSPAALVG